MSDLRAGQIIKYADQLFRVDFVNAARAHIVPLGKRQGHEMDAESRGLSISAGACVEIVTDLERARDELELRAAERDLVEATRALRATEQLRAEIAEAEAALAQARADAKKD